MKRAALVVSALGSCVLATGVTAAAQGWGAPVALGGKRVEATLIRKIPSLVALIGNTVRVRLDVKSQGSVPRQVADIFKSRLTAEVFKDSRIVEDADSPGAIVEATINELVTSTRSVERTNFDILKRQNVTYHNRLVTGQVTVSYRTLDGREKTGLDAGNLRVTVEQEFLQNGAPATKGPFKRLPDINEVQQHLIDGVVGTIAHRLVAVDESVVVPLPRGRLEPASKLGAAGRWGAMLEELEKMAEFKPARDDAFRHYAMGVAHEALAYEGGDAARTEDLLARAALAYRNAIQRNADESVFLAAQNRIASYMPPEATAPADTSRGAAPAADGGVFGNVDVIRLVKAKFSDDFILEQIAAAKKTSFDTSTGGMIALKEAGVSERVIKAILSRKGGVPPSPRPRW